MAKLGDRVDRFTLVRQLGAGGMATTWEAVRQAGHEFEQRVAIKLADPALLETQEGVESFRREAALAASLRHPNIAAVLDIDDRAGYIVCELVDGADLRAVLRAVAGGRLSPELAVHVLGQIARGLSHAHRRILRGRASPVIHRDMTPTNVLIDYDGNVKIVDFGIAMTLVGGGVSPESIKGKLSYMSPEQAMGGRLDGRADQYALGVMAYEALSGVRPNDGQHDGETLASILAGKHVPLVQRVPSLPPGLASLVERMLQPRPDHRFASMDAVLDALAEFTPALTVHRELARLVIAARQPHTIRRENGRFVSQPVEAEPMLQAMFQAPPSAAAERARTQPPALPHSLGSTMDDVRGPRVRPPSPRAASDTHAPRGARDTFTPPDAHEPLRQRSARDAQTARSMRDTPPGRSAPEPPPLRRGIEPPPWRGTLAEPPPLPGTPEDAPRQSALARLSRHIFGSRLFWQCLLGLGAVLLGLAIWLAFSPQAQSLFAPESTGQHSVLPAPAKP
jgi:serine/threonine-protein kinase